LYFRVEVRVTVTVTVRATVRVIVMLGLGLGLEGARIFIFCAPSVFSRSECDKRKIIWDDCVAQIQTDADLKDKFDTQMIAAMDQVG
jgi:hypothetical protein